MRANREIFQNQIKEDRNVCRGWRCFIFFALILAFIETSSAAVITWDGGGTDDTWAANQSGGKNANWAGANEKAPVNGDSLVFTGTTRLTNTNNITGLTIIDLTFNNTAGAFILGGNQITFTAGGITNNDTDLQTINMALGLNATITIAANSGNIAIGGVISDGSGSNGIIKTGINTLTLTGANTYTGGTTVNQGILTVGTGGTLGATTGALVVSNTNSTAPGTNTVLNLATAVDTTVGSLSGTIATPTSGTNTATINNGGSGRNFTVNQTSAGTYAGVIAGAGSFTLGSLSTNALTLTGTNTYTGATTVSAGTLLVNGSIASSSMTTVAPGAIIGGSGTVGALTVNGSVNPGNNNIGILSTGNYTQTGTYNVGISGTVAGTGHDQINVAGTVNITSGSLSTSFSGAYSAGNLIFILLNDGADAITGTYSGLAQNATVANYGGFDWNISYTANSSLGTFTGGNDIALIAAIPEPKVVILGSLGTLLLLLRRSRAA